MSSNIEKLEQLEGVTLTKSEKEEILNCPHEIHDIRKFILYIRLRRQSEKVDHFEASDGKIVNLRTPFVKIEDKVGHLPPEEVERIKLQRKKYNSLHAKACNMYRSATNSYRKYKQGGDPLITLLSEKKALILEYFGRMFTIDEVLSMLKKDWGINMVNKVALTKFYHENSQEINRLREKHREDYQHLRLTAKTSRLEELTWMYNKLKSKYEKTSSREDHKVLLLTMESIRKEVEGERLTIQQNLDIQIQHEVHIQIKQEIMKTLPLKEIILGRLSARLGIQPRDLINDLNTSYYAKMNRMISDIQDVDFDEIVLPSEQPYDFDYIKKVNDKADKDIELEEQKQKKEQKEREEEDERDKVNKESLKQSLLRQIESYKRRNINTQNELRERLV